MDEEMNGEVCVHPPDLQPTHTHQVRLRKAILLRSMSPKTELFKARVCFKRSLTRRHSTLRPELGLLLRCQGFDEVI